jgi:FG-GAP repeat
MRSCYATFVSLLLWSLCATAADPQSAKLSSPQATGGSWVQEATLTNTVGCCDNARAVAIGGNTVAVSPVGGSVFVYVKPASGWHSMTQTAILSPSNPSTALNFGSSIAIAGNTIVVGCDQATIGSNQSQGALYVFVEPASGWTNMTESAILTASDGDAFLGLSVGISGNTIVGGSDAAAYVFVKPAGGWVSGTQTAELTTTSSSQLAIVAISGNTVAASAVVSGGTQGGVLVYVEPSTGWANMTETATLDTGVRYVSTMRAVAISGDTVAGGAADVSPNGVSHAGALFVWVKPAAGWSKNMSPTAELTASNGTGNANLGVGVGINASVIVAGAPGTTVGSNLEQGAVYVFNKPASGWKNMTESAELISAGGTPANLFGFSLGISGGTIVGGAPFINSGTGAAYVFGQ